DLAALVRRLGWEPDLATTRSLAERTSGNPFFATELARLGAGQDEIPTSLRHVIRQRFERMPEPTRQALRLAAIMPGPVSSALLRDLAGWDDETLQDALEPALASELLRETNDQDEVYVFSHGLVRE